MDANDHQFEFGGYFCASPLLQIMWTTFGGRAKKDPKFAENINGVLICLVCCVVEHRLKILAGVDIFARFDNRARGKRLRLNGQLRDSSVEMPDELDPPVDSDGEKENGNGNNDGNGNGDGDGSGGGDGDSDFDLDR